MAFALKGTGSASTTNSTTANQSTFVVTTATTAGAAGDLAVLLYAVDNNSTTDIDEVAVTGVVDSAGNKWVKAVEFTNGQGTAQTGATCGIWYSNLRVALPVAGTVTLTFSNNTSRDAAAASLTYYTKAAGYDAVIEGTPGTLANDAAAAGSLNVTTANVACLRVRGIASEALLVTALTPTASFAIVTQAIASTGTAATSMAIRGEWIINTGTGTASAPTAGAGAVDNASVYVAFKETLTAWFDNNSRDPGAQVATNARRAVTAALITASAGLFLPPAPPTSTDTIGVPVHSGQAPTVRKVYYQSRFEPPYLAPAAAATTPEGWRTPLSTAPPTATAFHVSYDLPSLAAVVAPSGWGSPLSIPIPAELVRQGFASVPFNTAQAAVVTPPSEIGIPLDFGGQLPQSRSVYYQSRFQPPYLAAVVAATTVEGWQSPLSIAPPVAQAFHVSYDLPSLAPAAAPTGWQSPLSVSPQSAKAQAGLASVPLNTAQLSVNFTDVSWFVPLSTPPRVTKAQAGFASVPYSTPQLSVNFTNVGWQGPLEVAPRPVKAQPGLGSVPFNTAQLAVNFTNIGWQQALSSPPAVAKAQSGFASVPLNTAQQNNSVTQLAWQGQPPVAVPLAKVWPGFSSVPYNTAQVNPNLVPLSTYQQPLSVAASVAKAKAGFASVPFNTAQLSVNFTPFGWYQALSTAPAVAAKAQLGFASVPFNTAQLSVNFTNFSWFAPLSSAVRPARSVATQPIFVNVTASVPQGWFDALSTAPLAAKVQFSSQSLPLYVVARDNNVTLDKWQSPLSVVPWVAKAQLGFSFVPFDTTQPPPPPTNADRIVTIAAEVRSITVAFEDVQDDIDAELRLVDIAAEVRSLTIAAETRQIVIAAETRQTEA